MAEEFTREMGRKLVGCMAFCLRYNGARRLFGWFDLSATDKEALLAILKGLFNESIELDMAGLRKMLETFMDITDPGKMEDRDRTTWAAVADAKNNIPTLTPDETGRRIWYESLMDEGDAEWKEDEAAPEEQYFLTKLRKVGTMGLKHLKLLEDRWKKGEEMIALYKSFMTIANTTGPGQTILNLQLKVAKIEDVVKNIKQGNEDANKWATEISAYFNVTVAGNFQDAMKFFFPGAGYEVEPKIDWGKLREKLEEKDINALKLTSTEIKPANEMEEVSSTLKVLGETMLRVNNLGEDPIETEKEKKESKRKKDVRDGFKEKYEKWYQFLVANFMEGDEIRKLTGTKTQLIKYGEIVKSLGGTWADIRNFDSDFTKVRKLKYKIGEEELEVDTEDGLIEMAERIREAEEKLKEERKAKEDLQKQDVKRSEAMMKKENIVMYEGKASFLEWAGTITKLLEQLPESTADVIICSFVKTTINHKDTFNLIQNCKETQDIMKIMGELHATDKSVVIEAFAPIKQLKKPTTFSIAFHNGQVILRTADTLTSIGIEEAIELNELDLCVDKAIHDGRYQAWLEYSHLELKKLAEIDRREHPEEKTKLEEKGKYDITHSIQNFNKGRSLARNFHLLCKWIKEDMSLVQDAKDREERTSARTQINAKAGGNSTSSYFVQQNAENQGRFNGNRGIRQGSGGYRKPYGTTEGTPSGQRPQGAPQGRPNRHPDCQVALDRWRTLKGVGLEAKPMTKDCPLKCSHAIPFGNAGWCTTFRKYEPSMKLDVVKKNGLCRRCLSNWGPPHSPKDCKAPPCSKCKGDHHMLICPAPSGSVQVHATGFVDIYKGKDVFDDLEQQIMMLTTHTGEDGLSNGREDHVGQYYMGEAVVEEYLEDDIVFEDLDEPVNHFCVNFMEDIPHGRALEGWSLSQETGVNNMATEETVLEEERNGSKGAMGELKSDDTKPAEQKVGGGHLMTEADSLRTNADSKADTTTGYENTQGSQFCKVNTIRQADQNSEALWMGKPLRETGRKDLARGILGSQRGSEMNIDIISERKHVWEMTCEEDTMETVMDKNMERFNGVSTTDIVSWKSKEVGEENYKEEEGSRYKGKQTKDERPQIPPASQSWKAIQEEGDDTYEELSEERKEALLLKGHCTQNKKEEMIIHKLGTDMSGGREIEKKVMKTGTYKGNQDRINVMDRGPDYGEENAATETTQRNEVGGSRLLNNDQVKHEEEGEAKEYTQEHMTRKNAKMTQQTGISKEWQDEKAVMQPQHEAILFSVIGDYGQPCNDEVVWNIEHSGATTKRIQSSEISQQDYKETTNWEWIIDGVNECTQRQNLRIDREDRPVKSRDENEPLGHIRLQRRQTRNDDTEKGYDKSGKILMMAQDEDNVYNTSAQQLQEVEPRARSAARTADQDYAKMTQDKQAETIHETREKAYDKDTDNEGRHIGKEKEIENEQAHKDEWITSIVDKLEGKEPKSDETQSATEKQLEIRNEICLQKPAINTQEMPMEHIIEIQGICMIPQRGWKNPGGIVRWRTDSDLAGNRRHGELTSYLVRNIICKPQLLNYYDSKLREGNLPMLALFKPEFNSLNTIQFPKGFGKDKNRTDMDKTDRGIHLLAIPFGESPIDMSSIIARHYHELNTAVSSDFAVALSVGGITGRATCIFDTWKHSEERWNKTISLPPKDRLHLGREEQEKTTQTETGHVATAGTKNVHQQETKEAAENHLLGIISTSEGSAKQNEATGQETKEQEEDKMKGRLEAGEGKEDEEIEEGEGEAGDRDNDTNKLRAEWSMIQEYRGNPILEEIHQIDMEAREAGKVRDIGKGEGLDKREHQPGIGYGLGAGKEGLENESSRNELQLGGIRENMEKDANSKVKHEGSQKEEVKENTEKDATSKVKHEDSQEEIRGRKDKREGDATETTEAKIGGESEKNKEAPAKVTPSRKENNNLEPIKEQTNEKTQGKDRKESDEDQREDKKDRRTGKDNVEDGLWNC